MFCFLCPLQFSLTFHSKGFLNVHTSQEKNPENFLKDSNDIRMHKPYSTNKC